MVHQSEAFLAKQSLICDWELIGELSNGYQAMSFGSGKVLIMERINDRDEKPYQMDARGVLQNYLNTLNKIYQYKVNVANEVEGFLLKGIDAEQILMKKLGLN